MRALISVLMAVALTVAAGPHAGAAAASGDSEAGAIGRTPPRLSYTSGDVSFRRPGAQDWGPAQVNTPLAPGDQLSTGNQGDLEVQVGSRAFVRAWGDTWLELTNQEPDFLRFKITGGHVSLDLRTIDPGCTVEVDTPHGAFTIERPGYYRLDVTPSSSSFITRRAGQATMTPAGGQPVAMAPSEQVILEGGSTSTVQSSVAPELDVWDRWNYERSDRLFASMSARYVPGVYGAEDLDHYGDWRVVPTYGPVWTPQSVPAGWVPYSAGRWILDPYYGWTWVDAAPWGWAPYHYGRWVFVNGFWAWAPGPAVVRSVYAPALVAFFWSPSVRVAVGVPAVSWVALSWGEPLVPWWGSASFIGRPTWIGWHGPRIVNNVVINQTTVVNVNNIRVYKNTGVRNAVVAVREENFGRVDVRRLQTGRDALPVTPDASSHVAANGRAVRPPDTTVPRTVVGKRPPASAAVIPSTQTPQQTRSSAVPAPQIVAKPPTAATAPVPGRPTFETSPVERQRSPLPQHVEMGRHSGTPAVRQDGVGRRAAVPEIAGGARPMAPTVSRERFEAARRPAHPLPGERANRLFPGRAETPRALPGRSSQSKVRDF